MQLDGKVAVITGGGTGIGQAIAHRFGEEGASIIICGRRRAPLEETVESLKSRGVEAFFATADVSRRSDVERFFSEVFSRYGRVDILVNNAGVLFRKRLDETSEEEWNYMFDVNVKGIFLCCKAVLPRMIEQRAGNILNIGSVSGLRATTFADAYSASKAAVHMLTRSLARGYAEYGIRVNCICPGHIDTPLMDVTIEFYNSIGIRSDRQKIDSLYPLKRRGMPEDVASAALFLVSDESSWITGALLVLDGGVTA